MLRSSSDFQLIAARSEDLPGCARLVSAGVGSRPAAAATSNRQPGSWPPFANHAGIHRPGPEMAKGHCSHRAHPKSAAGATDRGSRPTAVASGAFARPVPAAARSKSSVWQAGLAPKHGRDVIPAHLMVSRATRRPAAQLKTAPRLAWKATQCRVTWVPCPGLAQRGTVDLPKRSSS